MNNKKGFTLVELLAVIVILAVLVILAVPSVIKMLDNTKKNAFSVEAENIIKSAKNAYSERELTGAEHKTCYTLEELTEYVDKDFTGYFGSVLVDPIANTYKIWLSKDKYIINGSNSGEIEVVELAQVENASTTCEDIEIIACTTSKHKLYVNALNGEFENGSTYLNYELLPGANQIIEEPTRAGYSFVEWQIVGSPSLFENETVTMGEEDIILTAVWNSTAVPENTLYIDPNEGNWDSDTSIQTHTLAVHDTKGITPPSRSGYTFNNWKIIGNPESFISGVLTMGSTPVFLEAQWTSNEVPKHNLYINPNGGKWDNFTTIQSFEIEEYKTKIINIPTKVGKVFDEWEITGTPQAFEQGVLRMGESDITLKATWIDLFTYSGNYTLLDDGDGNWRIKFLSNGFFVPAVDLVIDVFVVSGGSSGSGWNTSGNGYNGRGGSNAMGTSISASAGESYEIIIGAGGIRRSTTPSTYFPSGPSSGFNVNAPGVSGYYTGSTPVYEFNGQSGTRYGVGGITSTTGGKNTGNGGGAGINEDMGYAGGSGIVVIRNHRS